MNVFGPLKKRIPWQLRVIGKIFLSRMPYGDGIWQSIGLFKHGAMERPEYAVKVFQRHFRRTGFENKKTFSAIELGPGDSLSSAVLAYVHGSSKTYLVDTGCYARRDIGPYLALVDHLKNLNLAGDKFGQLSSLPALLETCNAHYCTDGLNSLKEIPAGSIDFIWSHAVLEHVRKSEFADTVNELKRILRPGGICSHRIDLKDHLGGALNNLRFSDKIWESDFMARSGFYTNRIRYHEMLKIFSDAGFSCTVDELDSWQQLPTPREKMNDRFSTMPHDSLRVSGFDVVLRPN